MRHFCPLCGFLICRSVDSYRHFPVEDLEWFQLIRAVDGHKEELVSISGIGYFNRLSEIVVPHEPEYFYWDPRASIKTYHLANGKFGDDQTFLFHAACWDILVARVAHYGNHDITNKIGYKLFQVLHCTYVDSEDLFQPGHDYGGIARFRKQDGNLVRDMMDQGYGWCLVEPSRFTGVDDILQSLESVALSHEALTLVDSNIAPSYDSTDTFTGLAAEVIHFLLIWLPSDDVHRLRLASRSVASKSHLSTLPQAFWRSRFSPDCEMGFALPIRIEGGHHNWRALYFRIKQGLRSDAPVRLKNRKRIWDIVSMNASTFATHLSNKRI